MIDLARRARTRALLLVVALVFAACGGEPASETTTTTAPETTTTVGLTTTSSTTIAPTITTEASETTASVVVPVSFETDDGLDLVGTLYPGGTTWVIMGGGFHSSIEPWHDVAAMLQEDDMTALVFANRGHGESDGSAEEPRVDVDAEAAVAYARDGGAERIVFAGADMNGTAAIHLADTDDLLAVVAVSGFLEYEGVDVGPAGPLDEPRLIVTSEDDWSLPDSMSLHEDIGGPSEIYVAEAVRTDDLSQNHGMGLVERPEVVDVIVEFILAAAGYR